MSLDLCKFGEINKKIYNYERYTNALDFWAIKAHFLDKIAAAGA